MKAFLHLHRHALALAALVVGVAVALGTGFDAHAQFTAASIVDLSAAVAIAGTTLGTKYPTLLEVSKLFGESGQPLPLAEILTKTNPILDDIPWVQANSVGGHRLSARAGYPEAAWRKLNRGVAPSKGAYQDVTETMGLAASLGVVDKKLVELSGNQAHFRMVENTGHIEAMGQLFATALFYGDPDVNPEQFLGLAPRFDDLSGPLNAEQIIDAGGNDTDLASIWLVGWGEDTVYGIYPKGSKAGLVHEDKGEELTDDGTGAGKMFPAMRDWFEWDGGIAVRDWRNIVRIANVDLSALTYDAATGAKLIQLMTAAIEQLNSRESVNPVFYAPRKIISFLRQQIVNKAIYQIGMGDVMGRKVTQFDGIPVRRVDALLSTESRIT